MFINSESYAAHLAIVRTRAAEMLRGIGRLKQNERIELLKQFVDKENPLLLERHRAGGGGMEVCHMRAAVIDVAMIELFNSIVAEAGAKCPPMVLCAVGGYGRGEMNPHSDVDMTILHRDDVHPDNATMKKVIEAIHYTLWDQKFSFNCPTRSFANAVEHANKDMNGKTAYLEMRYLAGDQKLLAEFERRFRKECMEKQVDAYLLDRVENQAERHRKNGKTVFMQEPHIKNGAGGLRDHQNLIWMLYFKLGTHDTRELVKRGIISESDRLELRAAYEFLLRARTELHYQTGKNDKIHMNQELAVADGLGYSEPSILRRTTAFMRDYYTHARTVLRQSEIVAEKLAFPKPKESKPPKIFVLLKLKKKLAQEKFDGFTVAGGRLYPEHERIFDEDPLRMMRAFQHLQERGLAASADLRQLLRTKRELVTEKFRRSDEARAIFLDICSKKGAVGRVLRAMHDVDFLGAFVPEFDPLTCAVQHEFFHRFTADEHTLTCIDKLDELVDTTDKKFTGYREIFERIEDPALLYTALLLHDTGKGVQTKHHDEVSAELAVAFARRMGFSPERRRLIMTLALNHAHLSFTAQRRQVDDPETIREFSQVIDDPVLLDHLMLLGHADGRGVGDETWSDWKESLVWSLYRHTNAYLADKEAFLRERAVERETVHEAVAVILPEDFEAEIAAHLETMPDHYLRTYEPSDIADHLRLFREFFTARTDAEDATRALTPALRWVPRTTAGHTELWIAGWNRELLLSRLAGSLSCAGLNIWSADAFTRRDDLVFDVFRVSTSQGKAVTSRSDINQVTTLLNDSLKVRDFDFTPLLQKAMRDNKWKLGKTLDFPTKIVVDATAHPQFTMVEVQTPDRLGLLYRLLRGLASVGAQIAFSRIATDKGAAIDTFYVCDAEDQKIRSKAELAKLNAAVIAAADSPAQV